MIICPKCKAQLTESNTAWNCKECEYKAEIKKGVIIFNPKIDENFPDYDPKALDIFYRYEKNHFWFKARRDLICDVFRDFVGRRETVIEIGTGTGNISKMLLENGYKMIIGDVHKNALYQFGNDQIAEKYQFDLMEAPFREHFDVIGMFDVLEHINEDGLAVRKICEMLKKGGRVVVTVPAHQWLWSKFDLTHKRRYELKELKDMFKKGGFDVVLAKNFFVSIIPLLFLRSIFGGSAKDKRSSELAEEQMNINPFINKILYFVSRMENKLLKNFSPKIGGSIVLVAIKK